MSDWIDENCEDGEFVYIMPFDDKYNEEIFRNVNFPERKVNSKICSSYGVVGTSRFPIGLFDAKYVLTCDPFPSMWTHLKGPEKLNNLFFQVKDEKFALAKTFDMGNGDTFYAYERVKNVDIEEIEYYLSAFEEEDMQFPDLYSEVVNEYIANNNDIKLQKE